MSTVTPTASVPEENGDGRLTQSSSFEPNTNKVLLYVGAHKSPRRHASCHAASARRDDSGIEKAKQIIFSYVFNYLANLPPGQVPFHDLEPSRVARNAAERMLDSSELATPIESVDEYRLRLRQLAALREGKASAHEPEVTAAVDEAVTEVAAPVLATLAKMADENPLALEKLCEAGRKHIAEIQYEERSLQHASQLARIRDALSMIAGPTSPVPEHKRGVLRELLLAAAHDQVRQELAALVGHAAERRFRQRMEKLREELRERAEFSQACREHLQHALRLLQERGDANTVIATGAGLTGEILLPGPQAEAVLNAMAQQSQCSRADVMDRFREAYLQRLSVQGHDLVAEGSGPLSVLAILDPQASVSAIDEIVQPYLGQFSLYQAVAAYGPARLADELYAWAEPLLHLSRENSLLNVELTSVTIVDLPRAETKEDEAIRAELQAELERHPPINVRETPPSTEMVRVVRSLAGYSAALLADNESLAVAYAESRRIEHRPHLFEVLPDAPDGFASEVVLEAIREFERQESPL